MNPKSTLISVFSFNMGETLRNCLDCIRYHCREFPIIIADDQSTDAKTLAVLQEYRDLFLDVYTSIGDKSDKRHGNLYANINAMCKYAIDNGYRYLFMVQDDMQFVRSLTPDICDQYSNLMTVDNVLQVNPRFMRKTGAIEVLRDLNAYSFAHDDYRRSYADVGILDLGKVSQLDWKFLEGEKQNKKTLSEVGMLRVFPFTPIVMHVPFPKTYRKGKRSTSFSLLRKGSYRFANMNQKEIAAMDSRSISTLPYFRDYLRPENLGLLKFYYNLTEDSHVFR